MATNPNSPSRSSRPAEVPLAVWPVAQTSAQYQRSGRYHPDSTQHPGKMLPALAARIVAAYWAPGQLVVDPMAGIGTTLVEAAQLGRKAVGVELEARWVALAEANIEGVVAAGAVPKVLRPKIHRGDARQLPTLLGRRSGTVDLVVVSPPYACEAGVIDKPRWRAGGRLCPPETLNYSTDKANLGHARGPAYETAMTEIYAACHRVLRPGGLLVTVTKNTRRRGHCVDLAGLTVVAARIGRVRLPPARRRPARAHPRRSAAPPAVVLAAHPDPQGPRTRRAGPPRSP